MQTYSVIVKLLYKSSNWLLRFSFFALPLSLLLSISTYLFIENLLQSYQHYLVQSYIGAQGRLSVDTTSKEMLQALKNYSASKGFVFSLKQERKANVIIKTPQHTLVKYAKFISLNEKYLEKKFAMQMKENTIFVNKTFARSMGSIGLEKIESFTNEDSNATLKIDKIVVIDTGFLGNEPIIYMNTSMQDYLFGKQVHQRYSMEFMEQFTKNVKQIKQEVDRLAAHYHVLEYKLHDILIDTQKTRDFFHKVKMIEHTITFFLLLLSLGVIVLAIVISIEFKRNSLGVLSLLGMSGRDLSITLALSVFMMFVSMFLLSFVALHWYKKIFLSITEFNNSFFIPLHQSVFFHIGLVAVIMTAIVYGVTYYIFQRE